MLLTLLLTADEGNYPPSYVKKVKMFVTKGTELFFERKIEKEETRRSTRI